MQAQHPSGISTLPVSYTHLHIDGGNYTRYICNVMCDDCNTQWKESFENLQLIKEGKYACPTCGSIKIDCLKKCRGKFCNKNCWKHK